MFRQVFPRLTEDELQRVVSAPVEKWVTGFYAARAPDNREVCCFIGHAAGLAVTTPSEEYVARLDATLDRLHDVADCVEVYYDDLCHRFGIPRVVAAIQARARKEMERRAANV